MAGSDPHRCPDCGHLMEWQERRTCADMADSGEQYRCFVCERSWRRIFEPSPASLVLRAARK